MRYRSIHPTPFETTFDMPNLPVQTRRREVLFQGRLRLQRPSSQEHYDQLHDLACSEAHTVDRLRRENQQLKEQLDKMSAASSAAASASATASTTVSRSASTLASKKPKPPPVPSICRRCHEFFPSKNQLHLHIKTVHPKGNETPYIQFVNSHVAPEHRAQLLSKK